MNDLGRVAEARGHLGGGELIDDVGAQRLVAPLGGLAGIGEVLAAGPHTSGDLSELLPDSVESFSDRNSCVIARPNLSEPRKSGLLRVSRWSRAADSAKRLCSRLGLDSGNSSEIPPRPREKPVRDASAPQLRQRSTLPEIRG